MEHHMHAPLGTLGEFPHFDKVFEKWGPKNHLLPRG
jgi:hypothetical protein